MIENDKINKLYEEFCFGMGYAKDTLGSSIEFVIFLRVSPFDTRTEDSFTEKAMLRLPYLLNNNTTTIIRTYKARRNTLWGKMRAMVLGVMWRIVYFSLVGFMTIWERAVR